MAAICAAAKAFFTGRFSDDFQLAFLRRPDVSTSALQPGHLRASLRPQEGDATRFASRLVRSGDGLPRGCQEIPWCFERLVLEMQDNSGTKLEVVLALAKKAGPDVVAFEAARKSIVKVVIGAASQLDTVAVLAVPRRLRLLVSSAEDAVQPGIPPLVSPPGNLWPPAVDQQLRAFAGKNVRAPGGREVSFNAKPVVRVIRHGCFQAHGVGVEDGRAKPDPVESQAQLPTDNIVPGVQELRLGRRSTRVRSVERQSERGSNGGCIEGGHRLRYGKNRRAAGGKRIDEIRLGS